MGALRVRVCLCALYGIASLTTVSAAIATATHTHTRAQQTQTRRACCDWELVYFFSARRILHLRRYRDITVKSRHRQHSLSASPLRLDAFIELEGCPGAGRRLA